ncbi:collagen-binding domain-containing protein [Roseateles sp. DB2]|uniref:collagen-binding domain-containing protein n=1 Tax=Roseateles sp. DB2 TaxID=3453717 RepID=UPI003EEB1ECA
MAAGLTGLALAQAAGAAPLIDLGVAAQYSAFIFGDVKAANDVEGRLAVGGSLTANGLSVGYRAPAGSSGPALVVGGDVSFTNGRIYSAAPASVKDSSAGEGNLVPWDPALAHYGNSYGVFGGQNKGSSSYLDLRTEPKISGLVDFKAAQNQLTTLSGSLAALASTGTVTQPWSDIKLSGSGKAGAVEVFDILLGSKNKLGGSWVMPSLTLSNVAADAWVVVNILNAGDVQLTGAFSGFKPVQEAQGKVLFNLANANRVKLGWVDGSVLAPKADLYGQGHVEGTVIGASISQAFEIGWEPLTPTPRPPETSQVPEPQIGWLAGLALAAAALASRRRSKT